MGSRRDREPLWYDVWFWLVVSNLIFVATYYVWGLIDIGRIPAR